MFIFIVFPLPAVAESAKAKFPHDIPTKVAPVIVGHQRLQKNVYKKYLKCVH